MIDGKLAKIVGAGNVSSDPATLEEYSRDMSFVNAVRPACVVKPRNGDDIAKLVKLANQTNTPLVPVSSGPPHFHGDTVPGTGGAVIVDLTGMNKVIRVDRAHRVAMVEPGVTFGELIPAVEKAGLRLNMPLLPRKAKTVVGSMLEREPVVMPKYQWDISDPLACVEVVFGSGETFRTGQAAGPGTIEEQWAAGGAQKTPYGPGPAQWNRLIQGAQGTMGIVTWASLRCELLPKVEEPFLVGSPDLSRLFELVHWLVRLRLVNECLVLNSTGLAAIMARKWPDDYQNLKDDLDSWVLFFNVAGYDYFPEERVSAQLKGISDLTKRIGVEAARAAGRVSAGELLKTLQRPSAEPYWKLRYQGACQDIFFITTYDKLEGQIALMQELANGCGYPAPELGVYLQPIVQGANCHCEFNLFYDPADPAEVERADELYTMAVDSLMATGAFFSRPYDKNARMIVNRDAAYVAALNRVKRILDPNKVMNPGKLCF
ncbi:MAG: FAD-binding oxidoreductase [Dehalococcoidia bacterium]|jgi:FAD/FMN-containing dehydrogenase